MAAAIITPARLDLDSRMSSVYIALPPPTDISRASSSSPASRQAAAGSRRNFVRNAGSASRRSISFAAPSALDVAISADLYPPPLAQRLEEHDDHRQEERHPERRHHAVDHGLGQQRHEDLLVAQRHGDGEARGEHGPADPEQAVAREHRRISGLGFAAQPPGELLLGASPQPRLAQ